MTVIEPPATRVAAGDPAVDAFAAGGEALYDVGATSDPETFLREVPPAVGSALRSALPAPAGARAGRRALPVERGPWEAGIPLDALAAAPFPKLVVSGAHHPAFDAICDVLESGSRPSAVLPATATRSSAIRVQRRPRRLRDRAPRRCARRHPSDVATGHSRLARTLSSHSVASSVALTLSSTGASTTGEPSIVAELPTRQPDGSTHLRSCEQRSAHRGARAGRGRGAVLPAEVRDLGDGAGVLRRGRTQCHVCACALTSRRATRSCARTARPAHALACGRAGSRA